MTKIILTLTGHGKLLLSREVIAAEDLQTFKLNTFIEESSLDPHGYSQPRMEIRGKNVFLVEGIPTLL